VDIVNGITILYYENPALSQELSVNHQPAVAVVCFVCWTYAASFSLDVDLALIRRVVLIRLPIDARIVALVLLPLQKVLLLFTLSPTLLGDNLSKWWQAGQHVSPRTFFIGTIMSSFKPLLSPHDFPQNFGCLPLTSTRLRSTVPHTLC
jgi:hypothetical protein